MVGSLCLLLLALGIVLWHDREFWLPDTPEADSTESVGSSPVAKATSLRPSAAVAKPTSTRRRPRRHIVSAAKAPAVLTPPPPVTISARTVLPPLEVEVVAGDHYRTIQPGSSSVNVDLQPGSPPQSVTTPTTVADTETAANLTSNAAERVQMSADASEIVARSVRPDYPLLARQMKVEGSVILQALIGKDGAIQNLRVVSGPHILASAAQDAVRQWHFKPHFEGSEAVETQAKITVNFTISTN
ncbi:MAG: energy transducer TonB [Candidatus Sulfotelmatobacter sp.]